MIWVILGLLVLGWAIYWAIIKGASPSDKNIFLDCQHEDRILQDALLRAERSARERTLE